MISNNNAFQKQGNKNKHEGNIVPNLFWREK